MRTTKPADRHPKFVSGVTIFGNCVHYCAISYVKTFFSIKSNGLIPPKILDLSKPACKDKTVSHEDPVKWGIRDIRELWSGMPAAP